MRALTFAIALGGLHLLARKSRSQSTVPLPLTARQYHDRLDNHLEVALFHGNKPMWDEVSERCREAGRPELPELKRKEWPEQVKNLGWD